MYPLGGSLTPASQEYDILPEYLFVCVFPPAPPWCCGLQLSVSVTISQSNGVPVVNAGNASFDLGDFG